MFESRRRFSSTQDASPGWHAESRTESLRGGHGPILALTTETAARTPPRSSAESAPHRHRQSGGDRKKVTAAKSGAARTCPHPLLGSIPARYASAISQGSPPPED